MTVWVFCSVDCLGPLPWCLSGSQGVKLLGIVTLLIWCLPKLQACVNKYFYLAVSHKCRELRARCLDRHLARLHFAVEKLQTKIQKY